MNERCDGDDGGYGCGGNYGGGYGYGGNRSEGRPQIKSELDQLHEAYDKKAKASVAGYTRPAQRQQRQPAPQIPANIIAEMATHGPPTARHPGGQETCRNHHLGICPGW